MMLIINVQRVSRLLVPGSSKGQHVSHHDAVGRIPEVSGGGFDVLLLVFGIEYCQLVYNKILLNCQALRLAIQGRKAYED